MKAIFIFTLLCLSNACFATPADSAAGNVQDRILDEIASSFNAKNRYLDSTITRLNHKVSNLDSELHASGVTRERMDKLVERMQLIEAKQRAVEANELNVYEANYQSAIINLVSMDRDIKPLLLFQATKDFFNTLTEAGNPMTYEGYQAGFTRFRAYVERFKTHDAMLKSVSDITSSTGNVSFGIPLVGAYSQLLFSSMAKYINKIGHRKRELKAQAENMFTVTTVLSQFTTDKNQIENEWEGITQSLAGLQADYDSTFSRNLCMIGVSKAAIGSGFTQESDAGKRYAFLSELRQNAVKYVDHIRQAHPKDWKEMVYYQLIDVQLLKQQYGGVAGKMRQHIDKYNVLLAKYKTNKTIGSHISQLDQKLNQLKSTFDQTFEPTQYAHSALQMYKVL